MTEKKEPAFGLAQFRKSPVTSVIGMLIMLASGASPFVKETITWADAAIGICVGAVLFLAPDTLVTKVKGLLGK
jgi:hypothetical protein